MKTAEQGADGSDRAGTVLGAQLAILGVVLVTAQYAPCENSDRAFRLLDWMTSNS
ncbi:hypothetical protein [Streptomyces sp. NPDC096013]|uniref:hypothetical protein n=1 Tax=Streptomyces sp. NPDC096013 TaxID=3366069 RepID=UPI00380704A0